MIAALATAGFGLLVLPSLLRPLGRRICPRGWSALCVAALLGGSMLVISVGVMTSLPTVLVMVKLPKAARACEVMFGHLFSSGSPLAFLFLGVTVSSVVLGARALRRYRRTVRRSWVEASVGRRLEPSGPFEVVLLDDARPRALSVPGSAGRPGQVLLTTGLRDALPPDQLDLVRAHEEAHLRLAHHRYLALAMAVDGAMWCWPPAKASARALRRAQARGADASARGKAEDVRARLASALLTVAAEAERPVLAAFSAMDGLVERMAAMGAPATARMPALWWPVLVVPGVVLGVVALYTLARLGHSAYCLVSMLGGCHLR